MTNFLLAQKKTISLYYFFLLLLSQIIEMQAQNTPADSLKNIDLQTITVISDRVKQYAETNKIQIIDTNNINLYQSNNLADILHEQSLMFVKSYGLGSLATASFRGTNAAHLSIVWNGFRLQSPMNGLLDLALLPSVFFDEIKLQHGASTTLNGSGAIGGTLHLDSSLKNKKKLKLEIAQHFGSFGKWHQNYKANVTFKKISSQTTVFQQQTKNNFSYINVAKFGTPKEILAHAAVKQWGILQENELKINEKQALNFKFWYQDSFRELPAAMTASDSEATQKDVVLRSSINWKWQVNENAKLSARTAFFKEQILYDNPAISLLANNLAHSLLNEIEQDIQFLNKNVFLNFGLNQSHFWAVADGYGGTIQQNNTAVFASLKKMSQNKKSTSILSIRQALDDGNLSPFAFSFGQKYQFNQHFLAKINLARSYRLPTFNDRYWLQGGNPDILAEKAWNQDLNVQYTKNFSSLNIRLQTSLFNNIVDNLMVWLPNENGIWTVENVRKVWARGIETDLNMNFETAKTRTEMTMQYSFVRSENRKVQVGNEALLNKQLLYVPLHKAVLQTKFHYKGFLAGYQQHFTGKRFTTSDNSNFLEAYSVGDIFFHKQFIIKKIRLNFNFKIKNIWNKTYQAIEWRPMPLRHYEIGVKLVFE